MPDFLSETQGCDLLARLFRSRGYSIVRNIPFREYGVEFHIDGWDAVARVGFEFLSSEDEDHDDLSLTEYKALMMAQQRGELSLFVIDEVEPLSAADLTATVNDFLDEVARGAKARRQRPPAAKKPPAQKPARANTSAPARRRVVAAKPASTPVKPKAKAGPKSGRTKR